MIPERQTIISYDNGFNSNWCDYSASAANFVTLCRMFQFQLVRLQSLTSGLPSWSLKEFQFQLVRLQCRCESVHSKAIQFQFQLVRLQFSERRRAGRRKKVSIPIGAITVMTGKGKYTSRSLVSIPIGAITVKRHKAS